jgi:hypothetical protein
MCRLFCAFLILVLASVTAGAEKPARTNRLARSETGLPVVEVGVATERLLMGLDTGTSRTLVTGGVAKRLSVAAARRISVASVAGEPWEGLCGPVTELSVAGVRVAHNDLCWLPDEVRVKGAEDLDGIIGADLLQQLDLWIDLRGGRVDARFAPPGSLASRVDGTRVPVEIIRQRPAINARLAGLHRTGPDARLVLDSGSNALVLFGGAAQQAAATFSHERSVGQLVTAATRREVVIVPLQGVRTGSKFFQLSSAGLLPDVNDRVEDGLLPLAALGPVLLDLSRRVIVVDARIRRE